MVCSRRGAGRAEQSISRKAAKAQKKDASPKSVFQLIINSGRVDNPARVIKIMAFHVPGTLEVPGTLQARNSRFGGSIAVANHFRNDYIHVGSTSFQPGFMVPDLRLGDWPELFPDSTSFRRPFAGRPKAAVLDARQRTREPTGQRAFGDGLRRGRRPH